METCVMLKRFLLETLSDNIEEKYDENNEITCPSENKLTYLNCVHAVGIYI